MKSYEYASLKVMNEEITIVDHHGRPLATSHNDQAISRRDSYGVGVPTVWQNLLTGQGGAADIMSGWMPVFWPLSYITLEHLHEGTALAHRIVWKLPKKAMSKGFNIVYNGSRKSEDRKFGNAIRDEAKRLRLAERVTDAAGFSRLYGGSGILVTMNDGLPDRPVRPGRVRGIKSLVVADATEAYPTYAELNPLDPSANNRFPDHQAYWVHLYGMNRTLHVHPDRFVVFGGSSTTRKLRWQWYRGWPASVLQLAWDQLRKMGGNAESISRMLNTASKKILATRRNDIVSGLAGDDGFANLMLRLQEMITTESSFNIMAIDKDTEAYQVISQAFSGVKDISENDQAMLAAAVGMPQTILLGRSPAGMNATGESDNLEWDSIAGEYQTHHLTEPIERVVRLIAYAVRANDPDGWGIQWPNLRKHTAKEIAEIHEINSRADALYLQSGAIDPNRLAVHRFGGEQYNPEPPSLPETDVLFMNATADRNHTKLEEGEEGT